MTFACIYKDGGRGEENRVNKATYIVLPNDKKFQLKNGKYDIFNNWIYIRMSCCEILQVPMAPSKLDIVNMQGSRMIVIKLRSR